MGISPFKGLQQGGLYKPLGALHPKGFPTMLQATKAK